MGERIYIFDTTLRDGEQSPGASMNAAEKLRLARKLEQLGVDVIEAGFPASSEGDLDAVREIAQKVRGCQIAGLARTGKEDLDMAWQAVQDAANPRIHTFIATSDIHLEYKLKATRDEVIQRTVDAVKYACSFTDNVEFSAEDATRSDRDYLCRVFEAAVEAGARVINIPDTVGYTLPNEFADLIRYVKDHTPNIHKAVLSVHCHNDLGMATSNTLAAVENGVRQIEVTMNGIGERAGNTSLEETVMAMRTRKDLLPYETAINTELIYPTSRLVSMITGIVVQPNKAIVGANAFAHEAGIHQDGVLKHVTTYEIMRPTDVGLDSNVLVMGKHSGRHAFKKRLEVMGYELTKEELDRLFGRFKDLADKRKEILDEDIEALVAEEILRVPDHFKLKYLNVVSGSVAVPTATVQIEANGELRQGAEFGVGPIDAAFNTIMKLAHRNAKLVRFSVTAITGGMDAQGEVTVRLKDNGNVVLGKGADPDIITASAKAFINGLNRLEHIRNHPALKIDL